MKKYILIILPLLIMSLAGCEQKPKFKMDIYVNTDAEICGVKDPMNNIDWLKEKLDYYRSKEYLEPIKEDYCIYSDSIGELCIVQVSQERYYRGYIKDLQEISYLAIRIRTCDRTALCGGAWHNPKYDFDAIPPTTPQSSNAQADPMYCKKGGYIFSQQPDPCDECDEFFATHTFVGFIARIRNTLID